MEKTGEILLYQAEDGQTTLDVQLEKDTVWLTQAQMADLFDLDRSVMTKHIRNIFKSEELEENSVCAIYAHTANDGKKYKTKFYNLDMILSVGYRANSKKATQFRIWANKILKQYLIKGYAIQDKIKVEQYENLRQTVSLLANVLERKELSADEATGLLKVVTDFAYALDVLDKYDHQVLNIEHTSTEQYFTITYSEAMEAIRSLGSKFGSSTLFGNEKDNSFKGSIATIYQSFGGVDLYPSVEEKAANLLYFVVKNHSFSDGNKRIAAFLFVWFLERNKLLYTPTGSKRIADNALVALTLMIAESKPDEKDMMVRVVVSLINGNN